MRFSDFYNDERLGYTPPKESGALPSPVLGRGAASGYSPYKQQSFPPVFLIWMAGFFLAVLASAALGESIAETIKHFGG